MKTKQMSVDIGYPDDSNQFMGWLHEVCEVFNLQIVGFIPVGPGGGNPEVTFRGFEEDLLQFSEAFYDGEGKEMFELYSEDDDNPSEFQGAIIDPRFSVKGKCRFINESTKQFI